MDDELELMKSKWWDYRLIEPRVATIAFIKEYATRVPLYIEQLGDSRHMNILKGFDINESEKWHNWKLAEVARRWCDSNGIAYDEFWAWATEEHLRAGWHKTFFNAFCGEKMRERVFRRFTEHRQLIIKTSKHPFFRAEGYFGCGLQDAYYKWLMKEVNAKYRGRAGMRVIVEYVDEGIISRRFFIGNSSTGE